MHEKRKYCELYSPRIEPIIKFQHIPWQDYLVNGKRGYYIGPIVKGWPPGKDRNMTNLIQPNKDNFIIRPRIVDDNQEKDLIVLVHSTITHFHEREHIRETWGSYQVQRIAAHY